MEGVRSRPLRAHPERPEASIAVIQGEVLVSHAHGPAAGGRSQAGGSRGSSCSRSFHVCFAIVQLSPYQHSPSPAALPSSRQPLPCCSA